MEFSTELTSDRIVRDIQRLQLGKVAELLGKAAYRKINGGYRHHITRLDRMLSGVPSSPHATNSSDLRLVRVPHSGGIPPVNLFVFPQSSPKLSISGEVGSCLGNSPDNR